MKYRAITAIRGTFVSVILAITACGNAGAQTLFSDTFELYSSIVNTSFASGVGNESVLGPNPGYTTGGEWKYYSNTIGETLSGGVLDVSVVPVGSNGSSYSLSYFDNNSAAQVSTGYTLTSATTSAVQLSFDLYFNSTQGASSGTQMLIRLAQDAFTGANNYTGIQADATSTSTLNLAAARSSSGSISISTGAWYTVNLLANAAASSSNATYTITVYNASGSLVGSITGTGSSTVLANWGGLAISNGTGGASASLSDFYIDNMTLTAIPEASTFAYLALGMAALLLCSRMRKSFLIEIA